MKCLSLLLNCTIFDNFIFNLFISVTWYLYNHHILVVSVNQSSAKGFRTIDQKSLVKDPSLHTNEQYEKLSICKLEAFVCLIGFYVTSTQYRSYYGDVRALLVEEDLRCPSVHYLRHERASE
jgi:hypothetical protein